MRSGGARWEPNPALTKQHSRPGWLTHTEHTPTHMHIHTYTHCASIYLFVTTGLWNGHGRCNYYLRLLAALLTGSPSGSQISFDDRQWHRYEDIAQALDELALEDLCDFFRSHVIDPATRRQFCVHVYSSKHPMPQASSEAGPTAPEDPQSQPEAQTAGQEGQEENVSGGDDAAVEPLPTMLDYGQWRAFVDSMKLYPSEKSWPS